jgi:hypothetical protein
MKVEEHAKRQKDYMYRRGDIYKKRNEKGNEGKEYKQLEKKKIKI